MKGGGIMLHDVKSYHANVTEQGDDIVFYDGELLLIPRIDYNAMRAKLVTAERDEKNLEGSLVEMDKQLDQAKKENQRLLDQIASLTEQLVNTRKQALQIGETAKKISEDALQPLYALTLSNTLLKKEVEDNKAKFEAEKISLQRDVENAVEDWKNDKEKSGGYGRGHSGELAGAMILCDAVRGFTLNEIMEKSYPYTKDGRKKKYSATAVKRFLSVNAPEDRDRVLKVHEDFPLVFKPFEITKEQVETWYYKRYTEVRRYVRKRQ